MQAQLSLVLPCRRGQLTALRPAPRCTPRRSPLPAQVCVRPLPVTSRSLRTVVAVAAIGLFSSPVLLWMLLRSASGEEAVDQSPDEPIAVARHAVEQAPSVSGADGQVRAADAARARIAVPVDAGVCGRLLQDGRPLAAATVRTGRGVETKSDAEGAFVLQLPEGEHRLGVVGPGVARGFSLGKAHVGCGGVLDLGSFEVPRGGACAGRVVDEREQPISGATVWASGRGFADVSLDIPDVAAVAGAAFVRTDADGRFHLADLRPGELDLHIEHAAHLDRLADVSIDDGGCTDCGEFVLATAPPLHGIVVDARGQPVPGALVVTGGARQHSPLQRRRATTAAADGAFQLMSFGTQNDLTVFAAGCEPLAVVIDNQGAPVRLVLAAANALQGRVLGGGGRPGTLHLHWEERGYSEWPAWVKAVCNSEPVVGADGTFDIPALPKGRWRLAATIPGVGIVSPRIVELPTPPLQLDLAKSHEVAVRVVDDLGAPVVGATVVCATGEFSPNGDPTLGASTWFGVDAWERQVTDAVGASTVRVPEGQWLRVAARSPTHVVAATAAPADAVPANVTLVLQRGAVLEGSLSDGSLTGRVALDVAITRLHAAHDDGTRDARRSFVGSFAVDSRGRFRVSGLPPGRVEVRLHVFDASAFHVVRGNLAVPVPWLGSADCLASPAVVELIAGETSVVTFTPAYGEITGRVMARGEPVAQALVFARGPADQASWGHDFRYCCEFSPHCRTGADGTFRFFVASGSSCELFARHERGGAWSPPQPAALVEGAAPRRLDIVLQAASIRGSIDLSTMEPKWRQSVVAQLYPLAEADRDPYAMTMDAGWQAARMPAQRLDRSGAFAYECVPPGRWVLRLGSLLGPVLMQRVVQTVGDEVHDLGRMSVADLVDAAVATGALRGIDIHLVQPVLGSEHGVFVAAIERGRPRDAFDAAASGPVDGSRLDLGRLVPGRYRLLPLRSGATSWGAAGEPCGPPVDIEVGTDGKVTPAVVWPDGLK